MKLLLIISLFIFFIFSCKKESIQPDYSINSDRITIKMGNHYPVTKTIGTHKGDKLWSHKFRFTESMAYLSRNPINQKDFNKLGGIDYGYLGNNSVRAGWRYNPELNTLEFNCYVHKDGKRVYDDRFISIPLDVANPYRVEVGINEADNSFLSVQGAFMLPQTIESVPLRVTRGKYMGAYFGGDETAPRDIVYYVD